MEGISEICAADVGLFKKPGGVKGTLERLRKSRGAVVGGELAYVWNMNGSGEEKRAIRLPKD